MKNKGYQVGLTLENPCGLCTMSESHKHTCTKCGATIEGKMCNGCKDRIIHVSHNCKEILLWQRTKQMNGGSAFFCSSVLGSQEEWSKVEHSAVFVQETLSNKNNLIKDIERLYEKISKKTRNLPLCVQQAWITRVPLLNLENFYKTMVQILGRYGIENFLDLWCGRGFASFGLLAGGAKSLTSLCDKHEDTFLDLCSGWLTNFICVKLEVSAETNLGDYLQAVRPIFVNRKYDKDLDMSVSGDEEEEYKPESKIPHCVFACEPCYASKLLLQQFLTNGALIILVGEKKNDDYSEIEIRIDEFKETKGIVYYEIRVDETNFLSLNANEESKAAEAAYCLSSKLLELKSLI